MNNSSLAFLTALIICIITGPLFIPLLRYLKFGQTVRSEGPERHLQKTGTPTMGGLMFIIAVLLSTLLFAEANAETYLALLVFVGFGLLGFADDYIKVVLRRSLGLKARYKLLGQVFLSLTLGILAVWFLERGTVVELPGIFSWNLGAFYPLFVLLVLVASTNAVNLTDGLDGLAAGITVCSAAAFAVIAYAQDQANLVIFALAVAGSCLGFLVFNKYPAKVFMGDTGSLALGGALGTLAVLTRTELLLPVIGGVYAIETLSVIIQVISFKLTGKRVFRMSPLHHHFELLGWRETKVVGVFWLAGLILAALGIVLWMQ
ncbi:phospho-N-acetylmuramoyl-pentapeptide-transferase [Zhaonella formicivorans]|uniref:phospho-N-acetylmuramoyl-pentapeptide- transferase n=1 Tax=Zhaonella formicivorans TaxID=2528593 RepID=UPI0010D68708|nr:phospho-N-acetylmuramoyl-pentapeptide-transferase [Zhaonella formicivorans]